MSKAFAAIGLTGGGVGDLDSIDGALLSAGDVAFVVDAVEKKLYQYTLNSSGTASGTVAIAPTSNPGTKTWDLVGAYVKDSITLDDGTQLGYLQFATAVLELYNAKATSGEIKLYAKDGAGNKEIMISCTGGGAVKLYYDNTEQLATSATGLTFSGNLDVNGSEFIIDADADTSITADTDDQIDIKIGGTDQLSFKDGVVEPTTNNDIDLGNETGPKRFKDVNIAGTIRVAGIAQGKDVTAALHRKILEIGDWNMDTTSTLTVAHGLTVTKIRRITAVIRNDLDSAIIPVAGYPSVTTPLFIASVDATNVNLGRLDTSVFDSNADYDATSYNRGWILIDYVD